MKTANHTKCLKQIQVKFNFFQIILSPYFGIFIA